MEEIYSKYLYENTSVLKNKFNIRDKDKLKKIETSIVSVKLFSLMKKGITGDLSIKHFFDIHFYLFSDIYDFAGKLRKEDIGKDNFFFAHFEYLENELEKVFEYISENKLNTGECEFSKREFAKHISHIITELNILHPFREGNGRAIREYIRELALKNGYYIDYSNIDKNEYLDAMKIAIVDEERIFNLYNKMLVKIPSKK